MMNLKLLEVVTPPSIYQKFPELIPLKEKKNIQQVGIEYRLFSKIVNIKRDIVLLVEN